MKYPSLILASLTLLAASCANVPDDERSAPYEGTLTPQRTVLIEEYTGQKCVNCPTAHTLLSNLDGLFNTAEHTGFIAVGMHIKIFALDDAQGGFHTPEVDVYSQGVEAAPSARINRNSGILNSDKWTAELIKQMAVRPTVTFDELGVAIDGDKLTVDVNIYPSDNISQNPRLQLWLVEDDIVGLQLSSTGLNVAYNHHGVFRAAINGINGEEVVLKRNQPLILQRTFPIDSKYNKENLRVVAFVYTDNDGVLNAHQARPTSITPTEQ